MTPGELWLPRYRILYLLMLLHPEAYNGLQEDESHCHECIQSVTLQVTRTSRVL